MADRDIDLAFCVDETGSMGSYIDQVKQHIISIITDVLRDPSVDSLQVGLIGYRDHPPQDSSFVTQVSPLTSDVKAITKAVNAMAASGGGDGPECMTDGLFDLVRLQWRPSAAKVAVLIADAPPHGVGEYGDGFPQGCPCGEDWETQAESCREMGIKVFTLGCVSQGSVVERVLMTISKKTEAQYFRLSGVGDLVTLIKHGTKDELGRLVVRERLSTLLHENQTFLRSLPSEQARVAAISTIASQKGLVIPSFKYEGSGKIECKDQEAKSTDIQILLRCLHENGQLPLGLFNYESLASTLPLPGLHTADGNGMVPLTGVSLDLQIKNGWSAEVHLEQTFLNKSDQPIEVVYHFPKESSSVVVRLRVQIEDNIYEGKCLEKAEAQNRYDDAIAAGKSAALLEEKNDRLLTMQIGSLPAHVSAKCMLTYITPLSSVSQTVNAVRIPTTLAPVFFSTPSDAKSPENADDHVPFTPSSVPYSLKISASAPSSIGAISCPSHPKAISSTESDGSTKLTFSVDDMGMQGDFIVHVDMSNDSTSTSSGTLLVERSDTGPHAYSTAASFIPKFAHTATPCNLSILMDCSGSMQGGSQELCSAFATSILSAVANDKKYPIRKLNVIKFGSSTKSAFENALVNVDSGNINKAVDFATQATPAMGGSEIMKAIKCALTQHAGEKSVAPDKWKSWVKDLKWSNNGKADRLVVLLLTDGSISGQREVIETVEAAGSKLVLIPIAIGTTVANDFLQKLGRAGRSNGCRIVDDSKHIESTADSVLAEIFESMPGAIVTQHCEDEKDWVQVTPSTTSFPNVINGERTPMQYALWQWKGNGEPPKDSIPKFYAKLVIPTKPETILKTNENGVPPTVVNGTGIHVLAASQAILEYDRTDKKAEALGLAVQYNIGSKYTSFLAVCDKVQNEAMTSMPVQKVVHATTTADDLTPGLLCRERAASPDSFGICGGLELGLGLVECALPAAPPMMMTCAALDCRESSTRARCKKAESDDVKDERTASRGSFGMCGGGRGRGSGMKSLFGDHCSFAMAKRSLEDCEEMDLDEVVAKSCDSSSHSKTSMKSAKKSNSINALKCFSVRGGCAAPPPATRSAKATFLCCSSAAPSSSMAPMVGAKRAPIEEDEDEAEAEDERAMDCDSEGSESMEEAHSPEKHKRKRKASSGSLSTTNSEVVETLDVLCSRQDSNGRWLAKTAVYSLVQCIRPDWSKEFIDKHKPAGINDEIWLTAVIVALIEKVGSSHAKALQAAKKAKEWLDLQSQGPVVIQEANKLK